MALVKVNGFPVLEAHITLPRAGRWHADLAVDAAVADQLAGAVEVDIGDGALVLQGTARRSGAFVESVTMEVVGGAAGLLKELQPKAYQAAPLQLPLQDALAEVGEVLSPTSDPTVLATALPKWIRMRGSALDEVVSLLARTAPGTIGRVLPDGTVWVGQDSYPEATITYDLLRDDHNAGQAELGVDVPTLLPGTTLLGRHVEEVTHTVLPGKVRTLVQFATDLDDPNAEPPSTSTANDLELITARQLRPTRYHRLFPARVVLQNADGSLELQPDSDLVPGLSSVPIRTFAPEVSVQVAPASRCQVAFEEGDPQRPVVALFEAGSLLSLTVSATTKVVFEGPSIKLGSDAGAVDALVKGTTYRAAEALSNEAVEASHTAAAGYFTSAATAWGALAVMPALGGSPSSPLPNLLAAATAATAAATAATAAATAIATLEGAAETYLSEISATA